MTPANSMKPDRGTDEYRAWVVDRIRDVAERIGVPPHKLSRERFLKEELDGGASYSDIRSLGGWGAVRSEAGSPMESLPDGHHVWGVSSLVDGSGRVTRQWIKTKKDRVSKEEVLRRLLATMPAEVPERLGKIPGPSTTRDDLLAVYPMGDPHLGLLSWAPETGEDFDLEIAEEILCAAIDELVMHGPKAKRALIANLGDFFHSDNQQNRTARSGHALDVDGRWSKVLKVGMRVMVYLIDRALCFHEQVDVECLIGNHDDHTAIMLSVALDAYYRNEPRVVISTSPAIRRYHRFGKNLIGLTHGHTSKHGELESVMAAEKPRDWGETEHRFWYCGHIHTSRRYEYRGCLVETFRTLAARDAWTASEGYRSGRDMNRIVLHQEHGEVSRSTVSAAYLRSKLASA